MDSAVVAAQATHLICGYLHDVSGGMVTHRPGSAIDQLCALVAGRLAQTQLGAHVFAELERQPTDTGRQELAVRALTDAASHDPVFAAVLSAAVQAAAAAHPAAHWVGSRAHVPQQPPAPAPLPSFPQPTGQALPLTPAGPVSVTGAGPHPGFPQPPVLSQLPVGSPAPTRRGNALALGILGAVAVIAIGAVVISQAGAEEQATSRPGAAGALAAAKDFLHANLEDDAPRLCELLSEEALAEVEQEGDCVEVLTGMSVQLPPEIVDEAAREIDQLTEDQVEMRGEDAAAVPYRSTELSLVREADGWRVSGGLGF